LIFSAPLDASGAHDLFQPMLARLVGLPRAPHPAATGGGFGFGKIRRDDQPSLRYGSARQGCLVQKLEYNVHLSFLVSRIRHLTSVLSPFEAERMLKVKSPDHVIGRRFRFFFQNVSFHVHVSRLKL
jgi:hypothetical protein